jgi:hypothetical protein
VTRDPLGQAVGICAAGVSNNAVVEQRRTTKRSAKWRVVELVRTFT